MSHYFTNDASIKHDVSRFKFVVNGHDFTFFSDNGVFSKKGLDFGTRTLLESLPDDICGNILDFGCGYGPIGIYINKVFNANVDMIDVNNRSLDLARKNALENKVKVNIFESNIYSNINHKYDYIITNPPIRVGKEILYKILFGAKDYLNDGGKLYLVINKDQGAKSLVRDLAEIYKVQIVNKNKGFFIICAEK